MKKLIIAALAVTALASTPAFAAHDGKLSTHDSVGKVVVHAHIPKLVKISGLTDLHINVTAAALTSPYFSREDANETFCIYSNDGTQGGYNIKIDGTAAPATSTNGPFALTGANGNLAYSVWLSDDPTNVFTPANGGYTWPGNVSSNQTTTADGNARPATLDCSDVGPDANLHIGIDNAAILAATAGHYRGVLTLTVSPI